MRTFKATTPSNGYPRLLGDVGGTNIRWAWQASETARLEKIWAAPTKDSASIFDSATKYLGINGLPAPRWACIGIATAITGDHVELTNGSWSFSTSALQREMRLERLLLINDFTALAYSLPALEEGDIRVLGPRLKVEPGTVALLGPGTGLGVSGLFMDKNGHHCALSGEGGHVTLCPTNEYESQVVAQLRSRFSHVSAERALSGPGLLNLYHSVCAIASIPPSDYTSEELTQLVINGQDPQCLETVRLFTGFLGNVAGNLALTLGARSGVYIGGGIVQQLGTAFDERIFRERFEGKGRFTEYLRKIPTWLITADQPALRGASKALDVLQ